MPLDPATLDAMVAAGFSAQQIATVVKAEIAADRAKAEAADAARRAKAAEKKRRQRAEVQLVSLDVPACPGDIGGQAGTQGDIGGQAGTPGDAAGDAGKESPQTPIETTTSEITPSAPKGASVPKGTDRRRGCRIPDGFERSDEARQVAESFGLIGDEADEALAEFADYWRPLPGLRATKLDWLATLRNRLREVARRSQKARSTPNRSAGNGLSEMGKKKGSGDVSVYRDPFAHLDQPRRRSDHSDDEGRTGASGHAQGLDEAERGRLLDFDRLRTGTR